MWILLFIFIVELLYYVLATKGSKHLQMPGTRILLRKKSAMSKMWQRAQKTTASCSQTFQCQAHHPTVWPGFTVAKRTLMGICAQKKSGDSQRAEEGNEHVNRALGGHRWRMDIHREWDMWVQRYTGTGGHEVSDDGGYFIVPGKYPCEGNNHSHSHKMPQP